MKPLSVWRSENGRHYVPLKKKAQYDVVVIGGGITGVTAAYLLKQAGKTVCLLERDVIGSVDTGNTTAHLTYVTDKRLSSLVKEFGKDSAEIAWHAGAEAIGKIEAIAQAEQIECEFQRVPGYLHAALQGKKNETAEFKKEAELARSLGFDAEFMEQVPFVDKPGIRFANQAKFHPLKYLFALAAKVHGGGSAIYEKSEVSSIEGKQPLLVTANGHQITTERVIIATHVPLMGKAGIIGAMFFQAKLAPYSSYVVGAKIPKNSVPVASFWDTSNPYYYLRIDSGTRSDYAIFGGADHKTGQEDDPRSCYRDLERELHRLIPAAKIDHHWSGQVIETADGLPFIGETAPAVRGDRIRRKQHDFQHAGWNDGRDYVLEQKNPWQHLLPPAARNCRAACFVSSPKTWTFRSTISAIAWD
ncbi:MAG: FAD-binding oxidoreductase [Planctomycetales bacterium]